MQNKGAIRLFAIVFAAVCIFQLSFTFFARKAESNAVEYASAPEAVEMANVLANGNALKEGMLFDSISKAREKFYLDSLQNEVVFNILIREYTYKEVKEREINLGLDLKGGMNVTLEVSVPDIIVALSGKSKNVTFRKAIDMAREMQKSTDDAFLNLFRQSINEVDPNFSLATVFSTIDLKDKINYNSTNDEVFAVLEGEVDGAIDRTFNILNTRINRFGVSQPNIQQLATKGRILVELPGIKDPDRVRKLLQGTAQLEFWETWEFSEVVAYFAQANQTLAQKNAANKVLEKVAEDKAAEIVNEETAAETAAEVETATADAAEGNSLMDEIESDTTAIDEELAANQFYENNPIYEYLQPNFQQDPNSGQVYPAKGASVGYASVKDTSRVNAMLKMTKSIFPNNVRFMWTINPVEKGSDIHRLVAIKVTSRDGEPALGGDVIVDASQDFSPTGQVEVSMSMNAEGALTWKRLTGENIGRQIAIALDGFIYSFPNVNSEIAGGRSSISGGGMTVDEAQDIANILKAGKLPAPARIVQEEVVGPSLGQEAISSGLWSFVIAFMLVLAYMIFFYSRAGWVADLALIINLLFIFGVLASLGAVLTLPGIAGIVLTIGMAVDANVIIFERIKEEVNLGKGIRLAITDGYKNAYSAIIDGNVTTLLTAFVLYTFGSGPIQGFATTLIIGIFASLFSAIFITRIVFANLLDKNQVVKFSTKATKDFLKNTKIDFLAKRKIAYVISGILIVLSIGSLGVRGLSYGVDFAGGRTYIVRFDQSVNTTDIRESLATEFEQTPEVKTFGADSQVKITTQYLIDDNSDNVDEIIQNKLYTALKGFIGHEITYAQFAGDTDSEQMVGILSSQKVGPTIVDEIIRGAFMAIIFSLIIIFGYIAIRFKKWQYGLGGVAALFHDTIITLGIFSMFWGLLPFSMEMDQAFIAAILTIIGYSINDTVIIFDRIREFVGLHKKTPLKDNINDALNSTLARTINTSGTTLLVLLAIFIFGGEIIRGFTFALLVGVLVGTYSSLFTASPISYDLLGGDKLIAEKDSKTKK
ncbi:MULTISPECIES: protein translocase subunit SecDF [unclassified Lentimicrobium]|uniref:protein translocase subunit SecDF n=1 Tax=unclassified Lentimicrobium TaxID=2677434 RepID=UPI001551D9AF|nr:MULTISPECIES: protein translocase subunit SecDF [unclassified Lentimicrobium]NPD46884.1 protein translocase subunit SecDF [Lentimicrobium sp. S6]NPD83842.1 protein translocase subunit SecDF [Lentimicrobium sp. L6]